MRSTECEYKETFCPECGCVEFSAGLPNGEKVCKNCGQSYFDDIDYSDIVGKHLREWKARADKAKEYLERAKAAEARVEALERFKLYWGSFYECGLEVANWHMNGEMEPLDNFIESAIEAMESGADT